MNVSRKYGIIYTMEFYSAITKNDIWFEGKCIKLEDIMLSEVSQDLKENTCMFSYIDGR
jgi:hypothetical protein